MRVLDLSTDLTNLFIGTFILKEERTRGGIVKYLIAWLLGIPIAVLLLIWLFSHLF